MSREHIFRNLVDPHSANVFAATWNVIGRAKKTETAPKMKKQTLKVNEMHNTLTDLLVLPGRDKAEARKRHRAAVFSYWTWTKAHAKIKSNGFHHPGLYFLVQQSLQLMVGSGLPFDVVIRTRFDVFPGVPFYFVPLPEAAWGDGRASQLLLPPQGFPGRTDEQAASGGGATDSNATDAGSGGAAGGSAGRTSPRFGLDLGSTCGMHSMWWPQTVIVEERKVLRHYADTRFKYFAWQACDWMDIAPYNTSVAVGNLLDWALQNNLFSGAQFADHGFFVDQDIAYQPLQLYLKIQRKKTTFFG